ncbi:MAG: hypothetical protein MHM6MM_004002 [Cercozoa sp. M6MM]
MELDTVVDVAPEVNVQRGFTPIVQESRPLVVSSHSDDAAQLRMDWRRQCVQCDATDPENRPIILAIVVVLVQSIIVGIAVKNVPAAFLAWVPVVPFLVWYLRSRSLACIVTMAKVAHVFLYMAFALLVMWLTFASLLINLKQPIVIMSLLVALYVVLSVLLWKRDTRPQYRWLKALGLVPMEIDHFDRDDRSFVLLWRARYWLQVITLGALTFHLQEYVLKGFESDDDDGCQPMDQKWRMWIVMVFGAGLCEEYLKLLIGNSILLSKEYQGSKLGLVIGTFVSGLAFSILENQQYLGMSKDTSSQYAVLVFRSLMSFMHPVWASLSASGLARGWPHFPLLFVLAILIHGSSNSSIAYCVTWYSMLFVPILSIFLLKVLGIDRRKAALEHLQLHPTQAMHIRKRLVDPAQIAVEVDDPYTGDIIDMNANNNNNNTNGSNTSGANCNNSNDSATNGVNSINSINNEYTPPRLVPFSEEP